MTDTGAASADAAMPCCLQWIWKPSKIPTHLMVLSVVKILRDMRMSPIELVTTLLAGLENLLDIVYKDKRGRKKIEKWVDAHCGLDRLLGKVHREMDDLGTFFKRSTNDVTPELLLEFNFEDHITEICREHTPTLCRILLTVAQTPRAARENTVKNPEPVLNLTEVLAPANYLLAGNNDPGPTGQDSLPEQQSLRHSLQLILSQLCLRWLKAKSDARSGHAISWDNTHITLSTHVEQRTLAPPKVQTGTTQIVYGLRGYRPSPPDHQTDEYVLRTTKLDEGSSEGSIQVNDNIYLDQLQFAIHDLDNTAVPSYNDQKTNALIRSARLLRIGDLSAILRMDYYQLAPGAFHVELNLSWLLLKIHRGNGADLGSLQYFIGLLAKVRLGSAQSDFETLVSLLMQVLAGAMLHYWEVECGMTLKEFAKSKPSPTKLLDMSICIFNKYASGIIDPSRDIPESDNTFYNLHLLIRDLLLFYFLQTSISSGDFGRVELLLGTLTMMFSGGGCSNYQTELLYFLQNLKNVWPESFA
ncbi:hypothetical protein K438DRAFT_1769567 [Mycena galopus ATCC 62051]|nr:hypothetical protein K438DRAFT_1769567 [Mycena galopus ATCC 62051]